LDDDGAPNSLDWAVEHHEETITRGLDEPSMVLKDRGLNEFAPISLDARVCALLIDGHESAVAGDISGQDSCETPRRLIGFIYPRPDGMDLT
jgi:hypothetical protein